MTSTIRRLSYIAGFFILAAILAAAGLLVYTSFERQRHESDTSVGAAIYAENCASCHGADLKGEADWQSHNPDGTLPAPPHDEDGHTWHHSDRLLVNYIKLGGARAMEQEGLIGFKSGMPAYEDILSGAEIGAVLDFIKSRWPEEVQKIQQERTKVEEEISR